MSIVIEGMDMPKCCGSCEFNNGYRCTRTETVIDRDYEYQERLSDCPIQPEQRVGRWIPVTERVPEDRGYYLVTILAENGYHRSREVIYFGDDKQWARDCNVIAWMPLPEPYRVESEE